MRENWIKYEKYKYGELVKCSIDLISLLIVTNLRQNSMSNTDFYPPNLPTDPSNWGYVKMLYNKHSMVVQQRGQACATKDQTSYNQQAKVAQAFEKATH